MTDSTWRPVISPVDQRVVSPDGAYVTHLLAGEEKAVHPDVFQACIEAGCSVPGQTVAGTALTHEETVNGLVAAAHDVYAANKPELLRADNRPRLSAIKNRFGHPYTPEQLEEALTLVLVPEPAADEQVDG